MDTIINLYYMFKFWLSKIKPHTEVKRVPDGIRTYIDAKTISLGNLKWIKGYQKEYEEGDPQFRTNLPWAQEESPSEYITVDEDIVLTLPKDSIDKSAYLYSNFSLKYGTVRALVKATEVDGAWSAFWLFGKNGTPEHDIFEHCGQWFKKLKVTHHWGYDYDGIRGKKQTRFNVRKNKNFKPSEEYYLYEVELTPYKAIYRINGIVVRVVRTGVSSSDNHVLFNIAKGGYCDSFMNRPLDDDAVMRIKFIEVYTID